MYPVSLPPEPSCFDKNCRQKGLQALQSAKGKFPAYWNENGYPDLLAQGFHDRCAYTGHRLTTPGQVDHYLDKKNHPHLAYEWSNYRYAASWVNQKKGTLGKKIMDPCRLQKGWLIANPHTGTISISEQCPPEEVHCLNFTIKKLGLNDNPVVIRYRKEKLAQFRQGQITFEILEKDCPILAEAILASQPQSPD